MKETSTMIRKVAMGINPMRIIFFIRDISKTTSGMAWEFFLVRKNTYSRDTGSTTLQLILNSVGLRR